MAEEWRDIDGYEGLYKVSNTGHTFRRATEKDVLCLIGN